MKRFITLSLSAALAAIGFVACGDDDDTPDAGPADMGTPDMGGVDPGPTVITGDVTNLSGRGNWGGLIIDGFAIDNQGDDNGELTSEASPPDSPRWFGGTDNGDSSGTLRYVIIAESGFEFQPGEEVQGLTLEAVGSGTEISYLQIVGSEDDGVEWFGGAVDMDHLVVNGTDDDAIDIDEGYIGNIQYAIVRIGAQNGDRGIESDSKFDEEPITAPNLANLTILGNAGRMDEETRGALHRENFAGKVFRSVYTDDLLAGTTFEGGCLDIDDTLNPNNTYDDVVFNCSPGSLHEDTDDDATSDNFQTDGVNNGQINFQEDNGLTIDPQTLAIQTSVAAPTVALPAGLEDAGYYGAVDPSAAEGWWQGWTYIDARVDGNLPGADFHPLQDDIESGAITPATEHACASVNSTFTNGGFVTIFGADFPVCVINEDITEDTSLPNNHVFVYGDFINVGTGGTQLSGGAPSTTPTLTIAAGTQILAQENQGAFLVITRGARIDAQGTAEQPVIFGAAPMSL